MIKLLRKLIWILVIVGVAIGIGIGVYISKSPNISFPDPPAGRACTQDAMMCTDGSYVGRTGPDCTFVCPGGPSNW